MERKTIYWKEQKVNAQLSIFSNVDTEEMHVLFHIESSMDLFDGQLSRFSEAFVQFQAQYPYFKCVLKRYFLSDSTNQSPFIPKENGCAVSIIQQPPLDGSKVAVWCYFIKNISALSECSGLVFEHNGYTHLFHTNLYNPTGDSYRQTKEVLEKYEQKLAEKELNINQHCIRTWFFIRDVDTQYAGMVKARRENFAEQGLTEKTHYIASTGIEGNPAHPSALVQMDAYAVNGLKANQFKHLYASTHLNPTYEYGVTFERGTAVKYGDRTHLFISGTASIDNKGNVLNVGNVQKQCLRMWENVEMLLKEGGANLEDIAQIIVYLRDGSDYQMIKEMFNAKFPDYPVVFTLAPVCRPTWLIEMECIAISNQGKSIYANF